MVTLLDRVGDDLRREILSQTRRKRFDRKEVLFHEGDPSDGMHLVESGWVAIRNTTPLAETVTVGVVGPGEALGEQSLIESGGKRMGGAVALTRVEALFLSRDSFEILRESHPSIDRFLVVLFDRRIRKLSERLVEALYVPAPKRVMRRVAELAESFESSEIPLTQEELASLAGTTRPTVNRALREAEAAGAIVISRGRIHVNSAEHMKRVAR
jgi:CRP/FNR family transcriptional regulator, cyclic AMP receptor protein